MSVKQIIVALEDLPRFQKGDKNTYFVFIPQDKDKSLNIRKKLDEYGWVWGGWGGDEGEKLHEHLLDIRGEYFSLYPFKICIKTGCGCVYWGGNPEHEYFVVDFNLPAKNIPQQPTAVSSMSNCMYSIPTWTIPQGCCPKCGGKLAVMFQNTYCPRCD